MPTIVCEKKFLVCSADTIKKGKIWFLKACRNHVVLHFPLNLLVQRENKKIPANSFASIIKENTC